MDDLIAMLKSFGESCFNLGKVDTSLHHEEMDEVKEITSHVQGMIDAARAEPQHDDFALICLCAFCLSNKEE